MDIDQLNDSEALDRIGRQIDSAKDTRSLQDADCALELLDRLRSRDLALSAGALTHYFAANAWDAKLSAQPDSNLWGMDQPERLMQIVELRHAIRHPGFAHLEEIRQCQILTNLANQFSFIGRVVDAIELFDRVDSIECKFAKALGNRGFALLGYAGVLHEPIHRAALVLAADDSFERALIQDAIWDGFDPDAYASFSKSMREIAAGFDIQQLRAGLDFAKPSVGQSKAERNYRRWCLSARLFLNPLNDLGMYPAAAWDSLTLPPMTSNDSDSSRALIGFFNQMKQEYVSARFFAYEATLMDGPHFSDKRVTLFNISVAPSYSLAVEKLRTAYRMTYSLLDKIAYFLNDYLSLGHRLDQVNFRRIWCSWKGSTPKPLLSYFSTSENWPLRGLYMLSKDIFEESFNEISDPEAKNLKLIRDYLEHKYFQVHDFHPRSGKTTSGFIIERADFQNKTLRLMRLVRAALIHLSLVVLVEEMRKSKEQNGSIALSLPLDIIPDDQKR